MRYFFIYSILFFLLLAGCNLKKNNTTKNLLGEMTPADSAFIKDTSVYAILSFDSSVFRKNYKPASLSDQDIIEVENELKKSVDEYDSSQEKEYQKENKLYPQDHLSKDQFLIDLKKYKYRQQLIPAMNSNGEKIVWVNCLCTVGWGEVVSNGWRKWITGVSDGGNCFFNVKINLTKKSYYDFMVNGVA